VATVSAAAGAAAGGATGVASGVVASGVGIGVASGTATGVASGTATGAATGVFAGAAACVAVFASAAYAAVHSTRASARAANSLRAMSNYIQTKLYDIWMKKLQSSSSCTGCTEATALSPAHFRLLVGKYVWNQRFKNKPNIQMSERGRGCGVSRCSAFELRIRKMTAVHGSQLSMHITCQGI
jgi:hypothetical protein